MFISANVSTSGLYLSILLLSLFFSVNEKANAQPSDWLWAVAMGGTDQVQGWEVALDGSGNVYSTGKFSGSADFDPGSGTYDLTSAGEDDIFISKLDGSGNFEWAISMGGTNDDAGNFIALDASGNVYTTGFFSGTADFDPGAGEFNLTSAGNRDIFISKLNSSGNFVWAKALSGTNYEYGRSIVLDASGNVYSTGEFQGTVDFDPGAGTFNLTSAGGNDMFISKLDGSGNFVWAKAMGGINGDGGESIAVDPTSGDVYTTGGFLGTADFDPGSGVFNLTSAGSVDIFISKLDNAGNFVWAKSMGGTYGDNGFSIALDASGNVYTTGWFLSTVDFDPGAGVFNLTSAGTYDIFISKLDGSGNFVWAKAMGGTSDDGCNSIALDASGNVYTTGFFWGTADFDPGAGVYNLTSAGGPDIFISKLDNAGNFVFALKAGGTGDDGGHSIALDDYDNSYLTGSFNSPSISFGSISLTNVGGSDIFVAKLEGPPSCSIVTNSDDNGNGSLRDAIACALNGSTITFDSALLDQTIALTSGEIAIKKNLILSGPGITHLTISGNTTSRLFNLFPGFVLEIHDMALKNATEVTNGGSILARGNLTLENVLLENNFENGVPKAMTIIPGAVVTIVGNVDFND